MLPGKRLIPGSLLREMGPVRCLGVPQGGRECPDAHALCPVGPPRTSGMLPRAQALFSLSRPSLCLRNLPGWLLPWRRWGPAARRAGPHRLAIRVLTNASLTGLPTPGSDTNLQIAAVLFLCWKEGAGRGAPAPLNDLPTKNKAFSLHPLCFRSSARASSAH